VAHYKDGTRFTVTVERFRPSLTDDQRARATVDRFIAELEQTAAGAEPGTP
jgi:hypothetical protein